MTEDPKELVAEAAAFDAIVREHGPLKYAEQAKAGNWPIWRCARTAALEALASVSLTADRERSVGEDVVAVPRSELRELRLADGACARDADGCDQRWDRALAAVCGHERDATIAATPPQVPEGLVLVPKVPTKEMERTFADAHGSLASIWSAMIAAAPALPETGVGNG